MLDVGKSAIMGVVLLIRNGQVHTRRAPLLFVFPKTWFSVHLPKGCANPALMKPEQKVWAPLWLEYSGLPRLLNEKIKGGAGWPVFRKIVELDCAANAEPEAVEITLEELGERCGVSPDAARKAILSMRKLKLVACFLPDDNEEPALLKVRTPLVTPVPAEEVRSRHAPLFLDPPQRFRYVDDEDPGTAEEAEAADPALQEIVDLYFNTVGLKMNAFILDELRLVRHRFSMERVRKTFRRAQQNEIRSLQWIVRELVRMDKKDKDGDAEARPSAES